MNVEIVHYVQSIVTNNENLIKKSLQGMSLVIVIVHLNTEVSLGPWYSKQKRIK